MRYTTNLGAGNWTTLQSFAPQPTSGSVTLIDTPGAGTLRRFYQIITPQSP